MSQQHHKTNKNLERSEDENQEFIIQPAVQPIEKHESNDNGFYNELHLLQILSADYEYINTDESETKAKEIEHRTTQSLRSF